MKPDWKDAPEWAMWLAMDMDGEWYWFEKAPVKGMVCWYHLNFECEFAGFDELYPCVDGCDMVIEHRPVF